MKMAEYMKTGDAPIVSPSKNDLALVTQNGKTRNTKIGDIGDLLLGTEDLGNTKSIKQNIIDNTTQLNDIANNITLTRGAVATIIPNNLLEIGVLNTNNTNFAEIENSRIKIKKAGLYLIQIYAYTSLKEDGKAIEYNFYNGDNLVDIGGSINSTSLTNTKLNFITMNKFRKDSLLNIRLRHNSTNNVNIQDFKVSLYWLRGLDK